MASAPAASQPRRSESAGRGMAQPRRGGGAAAAYARPRTRSARCAGAGGASGAAGARKRLTWRWPSTSARHVGQVSKCAAIAACVAGSSASST